MFYREYQPWPALADFVKCFWIMEATHNPFQGKEALIPDGCIELIFNLGTPYRRYDPENNAALLKHSHIVGERDRYFLIEQTRAVHLIAARFKPGGLYPFVRFPIAEVTNQTVDLDLIFGSQVKELECRLFEARSHKKKIDILQQALLRLLKTPNLNPPIINAAVRLIQQQRGNISVDDLSRELGVNYKYLERQFLRIIGLTPKSYSRIARFQNVMQALRYAAFHAWPSLALDCGYYDQAHFIKEFKAFTGATPSEFIARQNQIAEMLTAPGNV
jgi:AraC-like DNA-binding protein